jgi:hypothetical protein
MYGFYVRRWLVVGGLDGEGYMDPAVARALVWIFRLVIDCVKKEKANNHVVGVVFRDARRAMGGTEGGVERCGWTNDGLVGGLSGKIHRTLLCGALVWE